MFQRGQVWEWADREIYILLHPIFTPASTVYFEDQQRWHAFNLETGMVKFIIIHSNVFQDGQRWKRYL